jgi:hypothetical protein
MRHGYVGIMRPAAAAKLISIKTCRLFLPGRGGSPARGDYIKSDPDQIPAGAADYRLPHARMAEMVRAA